MPIISIEACIGAGKSTLLDLLKLEYKNNENVVFIPEPLDKWLDTKDENGKDILTTFYEDKKRWGYSFQMNAFITRCKSLIDEKYKNKLLILERSIFTDKYVFAQHLHQTGDINSLEMNLYNEWFDWLANNFPVKPMKYIYLKCDTKTAFERINKRAREAEMGHIPIDYLTAINDNHDKWLSTIQNVHTIDVNNDFQYNKDFNRKILGKVCDIIDDELKYILKINCITPTTPEQIALQKLKNVVIRKNYNFEIDNKLYNSIMNRCTMLSTVLDLSFNNNFNEDIEKNKNIASQLSTLLKLIFIDDLDKCTSFIINKMVEYCDLI
jgi:deoxyadenosine/deoxycytidine kinase